MLLLRRLVLLLLLTGPLITVAETDQRFESPASDGVLGSRYLALGAELQRYRALAAAGGWPEIPPGPTLRPGAEDPRLGALAERLAISGDLPKDQPRHSSYDQVLEDAVRRFQGRHGLTVDGLVGRATLRALNTSVEQRVDQIRVNLARMHQLVSSEQRDLLLVNVPAFKATLFRDAGKVWSTRVIIGEEEDQTPVLRSELTSVVFNPTWSVPHSIASEELLPEIQQDAAFLARGGYELYDRDNQAVDPEAVNWSDYSANNFPFRIMQRPGAGNQMGQVKFVFPNPYSVCMHDTPARSLFARSNRALSHGCIRVDQPLALAERVLAPEGWTRAEVTSQPSLGETNSVALSESLPLYIVYWTATVDESGKVHFYNDIYDRDSSRLEQIDKAARTDEAKIAT